MKALFDHIDACTNATLPGHRIAFHLGVDPVGWVLPDLAEVLRSQPGIASDATGLTLSDAAALPGIAAAMAKRGFGRTRDEAFDVRATPDGPVLAQIDRGALPAFGIAAVGVHMDGLVESPEGLKIWVARRAADKALDPGRLDHIVAGGVSAGYTAAETLIKEAAEEASLPATLATQAKPVGTISYSMERNEGLRRDRLHCFEILLPPDFTPHPNDDEVEHFQLIPVAQLLDLLQTRDTIKFNVALVWIALLLRHNLIPDPAPLAARMRMLAG